MWLYTNPLSQKSFVQLKLGEKGQSFVQEIVISNTNFYLDNILQFKKSRNSFLQGIISKANGYLVLLCMVVLSGMSLLALVQIVIHSTEHA